MPANGNELMTSRGLVTVVSWDGWCPEYINLDVRIDSYSGHVSYETWYSVPVEMLSHLGLTHVDKTYNEVQ